MEANPYVVLVAGVLSAGGGKFIYDTVKDLRNAPPKVLRQQRIVDASISTVARARDELEEDNKRLRATLGEERTAHAEERARWNADQDRLRADIARLEAQVREERARSAREAAAADTRYEALLKQVHQLRRSTGEDT